MASSRHSLDYAQAVKRSPPPLVGASGVIIKESRLPKTKTRRQTLSPASMQRAQGTGDRVQSPPRLLQTTRTKTQARRRAHREGRPRHHKSPGMPPVGCLNPRAGEKKKPASKETKKPKSAKSEGLAHTSEERKHGEKLISTNKEKNVAVVQGPKKTTATMATDQSVPPTPAPSGDILINGGGEQPGNSMKQINPQKQKLKHQNKRLRSACPRSLKTNLSFIRQKALGVSRGEQMIPMDHQKVHP